MGVLNSSVNLLEQDEGKLAGRAIILLMFLAQVIATLFLILRCLFIAETLASGPDIHALCCCLTGLTIAFSSLTLRRN